MKTTLLFILLLILCSLAVSAQVEKSTTYYENGQLKLEENYLDGERHGLSTGYYPNGKVSDRVNYVQGARDGIAKHYHPNGKLYFQCKFMYNYIANGTIKYYNDQGKLIGSRKYEDGEVVETTKTKHFIPQNKTE